MSNTVRSMLPSRACVRPPPPATTTNRWLVLAVILAAECMDVLDNTIVNVAISVDPELSLGRALRRSSGSSPAMR